MLFSSNVCNSSVLASSLNRHYSNTRYLNWESFDPSELAPKATIHIFHRDKKYIHILCLAVTCSSLNTVTLPWPWITNYSWLLLSGVSTTFFLSASLLCIHFPGFLACCKPVLLTETISVPPASFSQTAYHSHLAQDNLCSTTVASCQFHGMALLDKVSMNMMPIKASLLPAQQPF